jgi:hypothetical protein
VDGASSMWKGEESLNLDIHGKYPHEEKGILICIQLF